MINYPATLCLTATGHNDEEFQLFVEVKTDGQAKNQVTKFMQMVADEEFNWKTIEVQHDQ
jgi:hypothetical protein